jgi:hypothetical protein
MSFENDMARIIKNIGVTADQFGRAVKIEVFSRAILGTRVDTGRARGNWQVTEDAPAGGILERRDPSGAVGISEISTVKGVGVSYLTNNLPYIKKLEELDGMVHNAVVDVEQEMIKKAEELRGR